jgi:tetratricopeptide (TPR) repeat protein
MGEQRTMKRIITAMSLIVVGCQAANVEDNVIRLVEEGKVAQAQEEARKSGVSGKDLVRMKGILFHAIGMADSALVYLKEAQKDKPTDARISLRLAETLFWKKDLKTVRILVDQTSEKSLSSEPRAWETRMRKARLHSWLQDLDLSRNLYQKVLEAKETPAAIRLQARFRMAEITAWKKDFPKALASLDALLTTTPGYVDAALLKGQILEWKGEYAQAKAVYTSALQIHPTDGMLRMRLEKLSWVK